MKTGKAVKNSARGGKKPIYEIHEVEIIRARSALFESNRGKYLPHMGEKQKAKARR